MPKHQALLQITHLSIQSRGGRIDDLDLTADRGSLLLFTSDDIRRITALFRTLTGQEAPMEGTVATGGEGVGLVLAEDELPPWSTPRRELGLYAALHGLSRYDLSETMSHWDLEGVHHLALRHLNAYERTGLLLVMETALEPDILLCQEPLAGLNPKQAVRMLDRLREYAVDHLVILGTVDPGHYPEELIRVDLDRHVLSETERPRRPQPDEEPEPMPEPIPETARARKKLSEPPSAASLMVERLPVTVLVPLPVGEGTDYELRRISQIKFFEPLPEGTGYAVDVLPSDRDRLKELLAARGLALPDEWEA